MHNHTFPQKGGSYFGGICTSVVQCLREISDFKELFFILTKRLNKYTQKLFRNKPNLCPNKTVFV